MADDFRIQVTADLDTSEAESKLKDLCKDKKIKIGVELDKSAEMQTKDIAKSIEKGLKSTKIDTGNLAKQLADGFNITDKNVIGNLKKQMDILVTGLSKTWDGKKLDLGKATGFMDGLDKMAQTVSKNAKIVQDKMGIYDEFYSYFKNKKIFVSDAMKSAMGQDLFKEISNANVGKIVRDATKGISIDSIWSEMTDLFPEHFSKDVTNQVDQIVRAFDVLKAARADVAKSISFAGMTPDQQFKTTDAAYSNIVETAHKMWDSLDANIKSAADSLKTEFEIDVKVNTDNIISDIKNALSQAGAGSGEAVKVDLDINQSEIETQIRNAIQSISSGHTPVDIKLDVSRQSLEADLQAALHDIDLPVQFKVDASDIENQIRAAVASIDDVQIDVHINMDSVRDEVRQQFEQNPVQVPVQRDNNADGSIRNMNRAAQEGQTIFSALDGSVREAFQTFTLANLIEDEIYKVIDAGKQGIETVKSLDDAMLNLQMATGESKSNVQNMMQGYNALGQELGALTTEVSSSADTWLRQGRSMEETNQLIKDSMVLSKIGQVDAEKSSEILTATINGFQLAAEEASHINDVLSSIDLASASSVEGIGTALTKTASMANNAGVSLEKTAAIIATIKDVTQDSDTSVGNAVKSILSRMNQIKAGKFVDAETGEALNDVEKVLNKIEISMRDANDQFLDSEIIIDKVAAKWKTFDKDTQKAVATALGGTHQYNKLISLFDNYDKVQKFTAIANNSDGAAEGKFANYTDSLEAKTKSLQASLEALASDTLSSKMYAGFLDAAKGMADFAKETDLVKTALAGLGTAGATYAFTQLSTMLSNTITQVSNLGGGLKGLWGVLSAHPVALVTAGITAAVGVWNAYRASVDEAVNSAKQAGDTWEQSSTSIQDNISQITELRTALDSGKLTEQEAYDAKSQLLDIQNQLSESYGSQVEGIDLVNGSLDEQIAKLKELNTAQSERFLHENVKGIKEAKRQMEKERHTYLGQFFDNNTDESKAIKESIEKLKNKYGEEVFDVTEGMEGTGSLKINFETDASSAYEALNDFMSEMDNIESRYGKSDVLDSLISNAYGGLTEAKDVLDEYQDLYTQAMKADIQTDKKNYGGKSAVEWLNNYSKAVENYKNAVSSGSVKEVEDARKYYNTISGSVDKLLKGSDMSQYSALFTDVSNQLDMAAIKANEFNSALNADGEQYQYLNGYQKKLKAVADEVKNLDMSDVDFKAAINSGDIDVINYLSQAAQEAGVSTDDLAQSLVNLGVLSGQPAFALEETADTFEKISGDVESLISQINAVNSALTSQTTGKSIDIGTFNSDELKDYQSALEYVNGSMQINADRAREIVKAKAEEAIATNDATKAQKQSEYMENIRQIEQLQDELRGLTDAKGENAQAIQDNINALLSENDGIVNQCNQLDILSASLREATGAYQNWLDKQNGSEKGDMFDDAMGALQHIEDTVQNTKSEYYGRTGRESYKAAVEFLVPDTIDGQDAEAVSSYIDSIEHYFNHDSKGNRTGLDVAEFCAKATKAGLMELDEATNEYKILGQRTMEDFAEGLNLSLPMVQAMFGEMEEFNAKFDWSDEAVKTLGDMAMAAGEAKGRIEELSGDKNLDIQIDVSDIESTEDKISTLENTISQMQNYKSTLEVDSSQVDDANAIIQYCVTQKQMLEAPAVMSVDTSQVDGEIRNALSLLQQFQEAQNNVELQAAVGADTSEAQGKVDSLVSEIQGLSPEIKAQLGLDDSTSATITASIQALTPPELKVRAGVDTTEVDAYAAEEKQSNGTVTWGNETGDVDAWAAQMHKSKGTVTWGNDITRVKTSFTATGTVNWTNTTPPSGGTHGLNGTAHASGTAQYPHLVGHANAKGNWGTKTGGITLVGELGREIVVNPYTGTWQTVGDNGAEFKYIPAGSIVFNHLQSESLLERGFVNSRGTAKASGTAMVTGGVSKGQANIASGKDTYKGSSDAKANTDALNKNTDSQKENTDSNKKTSKSLDELITKLNENIKDWIEISLDRADRLVEKYKSIAENYGGYTKTDKNLVSAIKATESYISLLEKGRKKYQDKAAEVAKSLGLNKNVLDKIHNGTIDIQSISEDQKKKIEAYEVWYNKILECTEAIRDKKQEKKELAEKRVQNVLDSYDIIIGKREAAANLYESKQDLRVLQWKNQKPGTIYYRQMERQLKYIEDQAAFKDTEIQKYSDQMKNYLKKNGNNEKEPAYQLMKKQLIELRNESVELKIAAEELKDKLQETKEQVLEWKFDRYDRAGQKQDAVINYKLITDDKDFQIKEKDYTERMKTTNSQINALKALRDEKYRDYQQHVITQNNELAQAALEELTKLDVQIIQLGSDMEELKNKIMELRWQPFYEAQEQLQGVISEYDTLRQLIGDDANFNDDGSFTVQGTTNLLLLQESIDATKLQIANYRKQLDNLEEQYRNGCFSEQEYIDKTKELQEGIRNAAVSMEGYRQTMLDMYSTQIEMENDLLQKNIDKRLEALDAKEKYYDYDKTLRKKNKDINVLKAQIAALEGTSNAASKARLEKLKAELAEAEEDIADTVHQHETEMKKTGFEDMASDAEKALQNTQDALKKNTDFQEAVISNMLDTVKNDYDNTYDHLNSVIEDHGIVVSKTFDDMITKVAQFTTEAIKYVEAMQQIQNSNNSGINMGSSQGNVQDTVKDNETSQGASNEHVKDEVTVSLSRTSFYMHKGESRKITATTKPAGLNVTWRSDATNVATVGKDGTITAVNKGKAVITAEIKSNATATCTVYVVSDAIMTGIRNFEKQQGKQMSYDERQQAFKEAYNTTVNGKKNVSGEDGIEVGKDSAERAMVRNWFNSLKDFSGEIPEKTSELAKQIMWRGKIASRYDFQKLADIFGIETPGPENYEKWSTSLKNKILIKFRRTGFAKGGTVRKAMSAKYMANMLQGALVNNDDTGFITVNPGENIYTSEQNERLVTDVHKMQELVNNSFDIGNSKLVPNSNVVNNIDNTTNVNVYVDHIASNVDINNLATVVAQKIGKGTKIEMKKLR